MFWTLWYVLVLTRNSIRKCETSDTRRDGFLDQTATIPDLCVSALHASFLAKSLAGKIGVYTTLARFQTVRSCRAATCEPNAWKQRLIGGFKPAIGFCLFSDAFRFAATALIAMTTRSKVGCSARPYCLAGHKLCFPRILPLALLSKLCY